MKKKFKILLSMGLGVGALGALPIAAISCANTSGDHPLKPQTLVAGIQLNSNFRLPEGQSAKTMVTITDGGDLNDKSFNQSAWEGVISMGEQFGLSNDKYTALQVKGDGDFAASYLTALNDNYKIWVLPGFKHIDPLKEFYKTHKEEIKAKGITIVAIDFPLTASGIPESDGVGISLLYNIKEAGFMAGYSASKFLSQYTNKDDRTVGAFGGLPISPVTDFIEGFYKGIYEWNSEQSSADKKITTVSNGTVDLTSGFDPTQPAMSTAVSTILTKSPKLILPVAGGATYKVLENSLFGNRYVIGVDADQSLSAPKNGNKFLTSILKKIGQSVYDVLGALQTGVDKAKFLGDFNYGTKDSVKVGGVKENWSGIAKTSIVGEEKSKAEEANAAGIAKFNALSTEKIEWLNSNKALESGEAIDNLQTRLNTLSSEINKQSNPTS